MYVSVLGHAKIDTLRSLWISETAVGGGGARSVPFGMFIIRKRRVHVAVAHERVGRKKPTSFFRVNLESVEKFVFMPANVLT